MLSFWYHTVCGVGNPANWFNRWYNVRSLNMKKDAEVFFSLICEITYWLPERKGLYCL